MDLKPVSSSRMTAVGWDDGTMYIKFTDGVVYAYANVSEQEYKRFISSSSLGRELNTFQKHHPYRRVR